MTMRVVAMAQTKGGSSKSCTAINLACAAIQQGFHVALLDMDIGQLTSMDWRSRRECDSPFVKSCRTDQLGKTLAELRQLSFDWCFIDLPGRDSPAVSAGVMQSDMVLIPCQPTTIDVTPTIELVRRLVRAGRRYTYLMSISPPTMDKSRARGTAKLLTDAGHPVAPIIVVRRIAVPDAVAQGKGVNEHEPAGEAAREFAELFEWLKESLT